MKKILSIGLSAALLLGIYVYSHRDKSPGPAGQWQAIGYLFLGQYKTFAENKTFEKAFGDVNLSVSEDGSFTYHKAFQFYGKLEPADFSVGDYPTFLMQPDSFDGPSAKGNDYKGQPFLLVQPSEQRVVVTEYDPETDKIGDLPLVLEKVS